MSFRSNLGGQKLAILLAAYLLAAGCGSNPPRAASPVSPAKTPPPASPSLPGVPNVSAPGEIAPPVIRVGLASELPEFSLPSVGTPWLLKWAAQSQNFCGPLAFEPVAAHQAWRIQIGAFSEEATARRIAAQYGSYYRTPTEVVFAAARGLYQVRLGNFSSSEAAAPVIKNIRAQSHVDAFAVAEESGPSAVQLRDGSGASIQLSSPVDVIAPQNTFVESGGKPYRGNLRVLVNGRGLLNVINVVNLEDYLRGVVPAEMGPKHFDELEALKAQAVAARTYALSNLGQFESEGYDLCATPKCQVYDGVSAEDPLSDAAVARTRGLVAVDQGKLIQALFTSTCGGHTEDGGRIFPSMNYPYLKGVVCGELAKYSLIGTDVPRPLARVPLTALQWRGAVLAHLAANGRRPATRREIWARALELAGVSRNSFPPSSLYPEVVYPAIVSAFGLTEAEALHATPIDQSYEAGPPDPASGLSDEAREAYETLLRLGFGDGVTLPVAGRKISEQEFDGLLFSCVLRLEGITQLTGHFVKRDGAFLVLKTSSARTSLPLDRSVELAREVGGAFFRSGALALRAGDPVVIWRQGDRIIALWGIYETAGASYEKGSSWTTWVRRVSGQELMSRMAARTAGSVVKDVIVLQRSASGRAVEARIVTDQSSLTLSGFDLRQALGLPELLFSVEKVRGAGGGPEFVFIGRGWGHGVGMCQNGAYGMALDGATFDQILKHYYTGIEVEPFTSIR